MKTQLSGAKWREGGSTGMIHQSTAIQATSMQNISKHQGKLPAHFSGHETFPLRQMWLKKAFDQAFGSELPKAVFNDANAIATFGVGKNMVASIRHWALACGVIYESEQGSASFQIGKVARAILQDGGLDPYAENPSTAWLAHWQLAGRCFRSTTFYWLFNHVTTPTFTRQELEGPLGNFARQLDPTHRLSTATISRDLETCLRSYAPRAAGGSPEDFAEPLLGELGLLQEVHKGQYAFRRGPKSSLHDGVFVHALLDFWDREAEGLSSLAFETIAYAEGSPGRVFKLDEESIAQRLIRLSDFTANKLAWTDSAGLRQVHRKPITKEERRNMIRRAYD
ncbi:DUF4007 family protein [Pseudomonas aeruginosa]|uniref:DUF4007 family protein n=1 Tax=Pseudomonas aeruginosa TaxID=287 RepID=UPI001CBDB41A|nr:DUF4007 family protein [Pseudomonas aeruginosa]MCS9379231.1 DUF4007 family protein [Pseudomonas aeruginosa]